MIAVVEEYMVVIVWDLSSLRLSRFTTTDGMIMELDFFLAEKELAVMSSGAKGGIYLWDLETGLSRVFGHPPKQVNYTSRLTYSRDERSLAATYRVHLHSVVEVCNLSDGCCVYSAVPSPAGDLLKVVQPAGLGVRLIPLGQSQGSFGWTGDYKGEFIHALAFSPSGKVLASRTNTRIWLWEMSTGHHYLILCS
jgi:WD40 repeat protein